MDRLLEIGLSNSLIAGLLALAALLASKRFRQVQLSHLLWLMAFVKLLTPSVINLPLFQIQEETPVAVSESMVVPLAPMQALSASEIALMMPLETMPVADEMTVFEHLVSIYEIIKMPLLAIWLIGSVLVLIVSLIRIFRFNHLLHQSLVPATDRLRSQARVISRELGLKKTPRVVITSAQVSPMVWWLGRLNVVLPAKLVSEMTEDELYWVMAHELAHVKRRDHMVRWLEWSANVLFWWNPVVWWGRHQLRAVEEICCDNLVLTALNPKPKTYAGSVLSAIEHLAQSALRPPAVASEISSDGFLERRFKMIVSSEGRGRNSVRTKMVLMLLSCMLMPFGLVYADYKAVERKLAESVAEGDLSLEQAARMMEALKDAKGEEPKREESKREEYRKGDHKRGGHHDRRRGDHHGRDHQDHRDHHAKDHDHKSDHDKKHDARAKYELAKRFSHWVSKTGEELKRAIKAGKLSAADAKRKWEHFKKEEFWPKLKASIDAGKLSEQMAGRLKHSLERWKFEADKHDGDEKGHHDHKGHKSHKGHDSKSHWYRWRGHSDGKWDGKPDFEAMKERIYEMMKKHGMSDEDSKKRMEEIKKRIEAAKEKYGETMKQLRDGSDAWSKHAGKYRNYSWGRSRGHAHKKNDDRDHKGEGDKSRHHKGRSSMSASGWSGNGKIEIRVEDGEVTVNGKKMDREDIGKYMKYFGHSFGKKHAHKDGHKDDDKEEMKEKYEKQIKEMRERMEKQMREMRESHAKRMSEHAKRMAEVARKKRGDGDDHAEKKESDGKSSHRDRYERMREMRKKMMEKRIKEMREMKETKQKRENDKSEKD